MKKNFILLLLFSMAGMTFGRAAENGTLTRGGTGSEVPTSDCRWTFDNPDNLLEPSEGSVALEPIVFAGKDVQVKTIEEAGITSIASTATNLALHLPANAGFKTNFGLSADTQNYTLMMDVRVADIDPYDALFQTDLTNDNDAEVFISEGEVGVGTLGYGGKVEANVWHRYVFVNRNGEFSLYLDGVHVNTASDSRWTLSKDGVLLFTDNDGERIETDVTEIAFWSTALSESQISSLGMAEREPFMDVLSGSVTLSYNLDFSISLKTNVNVTFELPEWIETVDITPVVGTKDYTFRAKPLTEGEERTDSIVIGGEGVESQKVGVTQVRDLANDLELVDGFYQLNTQEEFDKWVTAINKGYMPEDTKVALNTNVTAASTEGCIITNYSGVLNGNFHTITLDMHTQHANNEDGAAFIKVLWGTVENVYFDGTVEGTSKFLATVAQDLQTDALVKNVYSTVNIVSHISGDGTHGGIAARCMGASTLKNVVFAGTMGSPEGVTDCCGGIVGWVNFYSTFEGCLMLGDMSGILDNGCNTIGRNQGNINGKNLYATVHKNEVPASCTIVTPEDFLDGAICYALNGKQQEISWWQTIGVDAVPTFDNHDGSHKQVFAVGDLNCDGTPLGKLTYNNKAGSGIPDHSYKDGICENCGQPQSDFVTPEDGWYIITTPEQLCYIANFASNNPSINIKIAADLDMSGLDYTPITGAYSGIFDGQHHTISNLTIANVDAEGNPLKDQALIGVAGGCTIKNLTLDSSCSISGAAYCAGFVGETSGSVTITMEGLFMHGNVTGTGANIAAIYACNMGSTATIKMTNCGMSGSVVGGNESGLISGWFGVNMATLDDVWAVGEVTGSDNATDAVFCRPAGDVSLANCWSVQGSRSGVGTLNADAAQTGELAWKLNGESFLNPTWFQNIGEGDEYPGLDSSRGVVYPVVGGYATFFPEDPASFAKFIRDFADVAQAYLESEEVTTYGGAALVAEYAELVAAYNDVTDLESFMPVWEAEKAKKPEVEASVAAYKNYEAMIEAILAELDSRDDFGGPARDFLENEYIDGGLEPGADDRAPNGSSDYILENRLLTAAEVAQETEHAKELLRLAVAGGYEAGAEITNMLVNANFANGFNGWQGTLFTGYGADIREGSTMHAAEIWSTGAHNMYQELVAAQGGVYELQVRGGYRPFDDPMGIQYYPYIYLNGNANYLQTIIEDYVPVEEAVDGENCYITPGMETLDKAITNEEGDTIGWAIHGVQSCNVAFSAGRYDNRILVKVEAGDILRVGINHPYSEFLSGAFEWVGIGDIHLTYHGELEESGEALDRVLESMLARANNLLAIQHATDENYVRYPNYSQALKDRVAASIEKAAGAADAATKYEVIEELSQAFKEIIDCKKAYKNFFAKVENIYSSSFAAVEADPSCADIIAQIQEAYDEGMAAYDAGSMSTEEALACEVFNNIDMFPTIDENGVYHIANTAQYAYFAGLSNSTVTASNGVIYNVVLDDDVCMNNDMVINDFYGTFDGQDHTLTVNIIDPSADCAAPFTNLRGATVKNLTVKGTISTAYKFAAGIAAHSYEANGKGSTLDRIQSWVDIIGTIAGDGTHGGILGVNDGGIGYITNSMFAGSMSGTANCNGGLVGWSNTTTHVEGCLVIANITADASGSNIMGRNDTQASNCYYVAPYGDVPAGATQTTEGQLLSGEVTYGLNGGNCGSDAAWRQDLGNDMMPTLDPTHKIVYKTEEGTYTNDIPDGIESVTDSAVKGSIYTINGIRVEKTKKGLYIIDGKKVMVK